MAKMRVYELADTLKIDYERTVELLREVGAEPLNHMSVVERVPARRVRQLLKQNPDAAVPQVKAQEDAPTPKEGEKADRKVEAQRSESDHPAEARVPSAGSAIKDTAPSTTEAATAQQPAPPAAAEGPARSRTAAAQPTSKQAEGRAESAQRRSSAAAEGAAQRTAKARPEAGTAAKAPMSPAATPRAASPDAPAKAPASRETLPFREVGPPPTSQIRRVRGPEPSSRPTAASRPTRTQRTPAASTASATPTATAETSRQPARRSAPAAAKGAPQSENRQASAQAPARRGGGAGRTGGRPQGAPGRSASPGARSTPQRRSRGSAARRASARERQAQAAAPSRPTGPLVIPDSITVQEFADKLGIPATAIIKSLMQVGVMAAINQRIDHETASLVAEKLGVEVERPEVRTVQQYDGTDEPTENLVKRPPVVTIMGHVDHGKTSLLDAIRRTKVVEKEAGGITQHIGAYQVEVDGEKITFLDTPGHEAFTSMRSRGAQVTDIAVLVVAADDGVMPQTIEAISHARAAEVPIMVAINKIDRPAANVDRVLQQLAEQNLVPEDWGGDTVCVPVSALMNEGIDTLLEMILLVAELHDLKANPDRPARGVVIDAELDRNRGPVATLLVQAGTLRTGDSIVAGATYGRVRAMFDDSGEVVHEAEPSRPVVLLGLQDVPQAGDLVEVVGDDRTAREHAERRAAEHEIADTTAAAGRIRLSEIYSQEGEVKDLNLLLKADVQGSLEALHHSIERLSTDEVRVNIIHTAVGGVNESDVALAAASNAIIIGFNVRPETTARRAAEREGIEVKTYRVIYEALDEIKAAMQGLLDPHYEEQVLGRAEVRALFRVPNVGVVAGAYVIDGKVTRNSKVRVLRDSVVIHEGELASLKRFKDDVREVAEGYECGFSVKDYDDLKEGDLIEAYVMKEIERKLE